MSRDPKTALNINTPNINLRRNYYEDALYQNCASANRSHLPHNDSHAGSSVGLEVSWTDLFINRIEADFVLIYAPHLTYRRLRYDMGRRICLHSFETTYRPDTLKRLPKPDQDIKKNVPKQTYNIPQNQSLRPIAPTYGRPGSYQ